jgi:hypothetical protein
MGWFAEIVSTAQNPIGGPANHLFKRYARPMKQRVASFRVAEERLASFRP